MIFVVGGQFSGKGEYVRENFNINKITPYDAEYDTFKTAAAVRDFHLYVKKIMLAGGDVLSEIKRLIADNPDIIIISDEIGCGVVPECDSDRKWREITGRIYCYIASKAEKVIRVVCGIGNVIK